jgi:predicted anti-sigma-YlaC factor YlaD
MMKCAEIAELVSKELDAELPLSQRMAIRLHLAMCKMCRGFSKQLKFIHRLSMAAGGSESHSALAEGNLLQDSLSTDAKARMKTSISSQTD